MAETILHVIESVGRVSWRSAQFGDLVITTERAVFLKYVEFEPEGNDLMYATRGLIGLVGWLEKQGQEQQALLRAWERTDDVRLRKYGTTLDERIQDKLSEWSASGAPWEVEWHPSRAAVIVRTKHGGEEHFALRPESQRDASQAPDLLGNHPSYDFAADPQGFSLPYPSPKALIVRSLEGYGVEDKDMEAMGQNCNYIAALSYELFSLARPRRIAAASAFSKSPKAFRAALIEAIENPRWPKKRMPATLLVFGLLFVMCAVGVAHGSGPGWWHHARNWIGVLLFTMLGGCLAIAFVHERLNGIADDRCTSTICSLLGRC